MGEPAPIIHQWPRSLCSTGGCSLGVARHRGLTPLSCWLAPRPSRHWHVVPPLCWGLVPLGLLRRAAGPGLRHALCGASPRGAFRNLGGSLLAPLPLPNPQPHGGACAASGLSSGTGEGLTSGGSAAWPVSWALAAGKLQEHWLQRVWNWLRPAGKCGVSPRPRPRLQPQQHRTEHSDPGASRCLVCSL